MTVSTMCVIIQLEGPWGGSTRGQEFCDMATSIEKIELGYDDSKLERLFKVTYNILGKTTVRSYLRDSPTSDNSHHKKTVCSQLRLLFSSLSSTASLIYIIFLQ